MTDLIPTRKEASAQLARRKADRLPARIDAAEQNVTTFGGITVVFTVLSGLAAIAGAWIPAGLVALVAGGCWFARKGAKERLRTLEAEESYLITTGDLDDF